MKRTIQRRVRINTQPEAAASPQEIGSMFLAKTEPSSSSNDTISEEELANRIVASWQKAVKSIIETGRLLIEAKLRIGHGNLSHIRGCLAVPDCVGNLYSLKQIAAGRI